MENLQHYYNSMRTLHNLQYIHFLLCINHCVKFYNTVTSQKTHNTTIVINPITYTLPKNTWYKMSGIFTVVIIVKTISFTS